MADRKIEFNKITDARGGAAFTVRCVTRAANTEAVGIQDDGSLKIRLVASPAGSDEANAELVDFISKALEVDPSKIEIVAGKDGRDKLISVEDVTTRQVEQIIGNLG